MHLKKPNYEAKQRKRWHCAYLDQETWKARILQGKDVEEVNVRHIYIYSLSLFGF
jgi:Uri superfamily endonuclease